MRGGVEQAVPVEQVRPGDVFVVRPGEQIPVDGVVRDGTGAVDEAALTGESLPVDKAAGAPVYAATLKPDGLSALRGHARGRGYDALADHPHGRRRGGDEGADRQGGGPGVRRVRAGGDRRRPR